MVKDTRGIHYFYLTAFSALRFLVDGTNVGIQETPTLENKREEEQ